MHPHERNVSHAFNKARATYQQHARVQACVGQQLIQYLLTINNNFCRVVDAGCGPGFITTQLANAIHYQTFHAIDTTRSLLPQIDLPATVKCVAMNFNDISATSADLIFANMSLHWSHSFTHTLHVLHDALTANGLLAFTIPLHGTFAEISGHFSIQKFTMMKATAELLRNNGFKILFTNQVTYLDHFPDTISALRSIKLTGTHYTGLRKCNTLRGKSFLTQLAISELSYVIGFFIAEKQDG
jgi:malonyl-CoA O-methyltransferase